MNKDILTRFITKYALGGVVESVKLTVKDATANTLFSTADKTLVGAISMQNFDLDDIEVGIFDTPKLQKLLSVLGNVITPVIKYANNTPMYISFHDMNTVVNYMLADLSVIPRPSVLKKLPNWDLTMNIDSDFSSRFIRSKAALSDSEYFTIIKDGDYYAIVLGYSEINSTRVTLHTDVPAPDGFKPISFSAPYFKEILTANRDATNGTLMVSSQGLAGVEFRGDDFNSSYYLAKFNI